MDAVPSLCATSTVGVAAIGYAFGRLSTDDSRPHSNKRKFHSFVYNDIGHSSTPSTPTAGLPPTSASTTHGSIPSVLRRPQSASFFRNSARTSDIGAASRGISEGFALRESTVVDSALPDVLGSGMGTARSSWLRRMSTFSSSREPSPISASRPGTPSLSFSNGSSAPIIASTASPVLARNRLVKRASSQRAFNESGFGQASYSKSHVPTLRRPATSHQRSANLQEQIFYSNPGMLRDKTHHSAQHDDRFLTSKEDAEESSKHWQFHFRLQTNYLSKETPSKYGTASRRPARNGSVISMVPVAGDTPVLLKAELISKPLRDDALPHPFTSAYSSSPSTPLAAHPFPVTSPNVDDTDTNSEQESKPRSSFSIADMFPSPSPSTWKVGRPGSLRRKRGPTNAITGRRIASAPQPSRSVRTSNETSDYTLQSRATENSLLKTPSSPLPPLNRFSAFEVDLPNSSASYPDSPQLQHRYSPSSPTSPSPAFNVDPVLNATQRARSHRPSGAPSDRASTLISSDNENSRVFSTDGDDLDCRSETIYDSMRTGATGSSHSGIRGSNIETVFDTSPPAELLKQNLVALQEKLSNTHAIGDFIAEEEESIGTPVGVVRPVERDMSTPSRYPLHISSSPDLPSSPPQVPSASQRVYNANRVVRNSFDEEDWSLDPVESTSWDHDDAKDCTPERALPKVMELRTLDKSPLQGEGTTSEQVVLEDDRPKSNIFKWSECSHLEKENEEGSSPRPRTVHGKQVIERGSRSTGRRGPSALHLRSQSVPLSPDNTTHRTLSNTTKLDAWILGGKGVSEDWDGDFEFDEPIKPSASDADGGTKHKANKSGGMLVPRAILERQDSVHGQFGQVKELTHLVEELKRLRHQAHTYGIVYGQSSELWKEAEGIINLATLDDEEQDFFPPRSPNSPSFDSDLFEDDTVMAQRHQNTHFAALIDDHSYTERITSHQSISQSSPGPSIPETPPRGRPRKESTANAMSVLEHIHQQRKNLSPPVGETVSMQKKLPFDTTSLRDLVTRAGVVTRALKEIIRKAENSQESFQTPELRPSGPTDPVFSQMFHKPSSSPPLNKSPRSVKSTNHNGFLSSSITGNDNDINGHMKMMTVI